MVRSHEHGAISTKPTLTSHAELPLQLTWLGNSYTQHFEHTGDLQDNDNAIFYHQRAIESTPHSDNNFPGRLSNLGGSYSDRFKYTGDLQDIDYAISHFQRAVESTPSGHVDLPYVLSNLGKSYIDCFTCMHDLKDINSAIFHLENAVKSIPINGAPSTLLNNLGASYLSRFNLTRNLQDIDLAISYLQRAVESTPSSYTNLPTWFNNLGNSYRSHSKHTNDLQDIDHSISYHQHAIESIPSGHAKLPSLLINLALSYTERFKSSGNLKDIDYAISHQESAIKSTPSGNAHLCIFFGNLGKSYELCFQHTHNLPDVQNSIAFYHQAAEGNGSPSARLVAAAVAALLSSELGDSGCLIDFALAISLLSELAGLEQTIHHQYAKLCGYPPVVPVAVANALHYNRPDLALEWLEQGRCLVWNQLNQLHTPVNSLHMRNPSLADRFVKVAKALESDGTCLALSSHSSYATLAEEIHIQDNTRDHTFHAADYRQLLKEIRDLPDFHDFLQPPNATNLLSSLRSDGPVIIFNLYEAQCDALALIAGIKKPLHIPLKNFSLV